MRIIDLVLRHYPRGGNLKLTLLVLADFANDDGICWPANATVAAKTCQSVRNACYCLRQLQREAVIQLLSASTGGKGITNRYLIRVQTLLGFPDLTRYKPAKRASKSMQNSSATLQSATDTLQAVAYDPSEPSIEPPARTVMERKLACTNCTLPETFRPKESHQRLAARLGLDLSLTFEKFCEHHLAKRSRFIDWDRALNFWLLNERGNGNGKHNAAEQQLVLTTRSSAKSLDPPRVAAMLSRAVPGIDQPAIDRIISACEEAASADGAEADTDVFVFILNELLDRSPGIRNLVGFLIKQLPLHFEGEAYRQARANQKAAAESRRQRELSREVQHELDVQHEVDWCEEEKERERLEGVLDAMPGEKRAKLLADVREELLRERPQAKQWRPEALDKYMRLRAVWLLAEAQS